tara:strand:+ start:183 stop:428 length:246 start_codon:yes stop_codon:yes gene_type:complete
MRFLLINMIKEKFNEKQYWEERTKAYLKETETISQWNKNTQIEQLNHIKDLEKHIDYIQRVLKEKQDELFCAKIEYEQFNE